MEGEAREQFVESAKEQFEQYVDIEAQAANMEVDELLPAGDLRGQLEARLAAFATKRRTERPRHHGTVLF